MIIDSGVITGSLVVSGSYRQTGSAVIDGNLTVLGTLNATISGSATSASYARNADTASLAPAYLPLVGGTVTGNLVVNGTGSFNVLVTNYESSSVIYSSGSTKFGDSFDDTHQFTGSVTVSGGPLQVDGSTVILTNQTSSMSVQTAATSSYPFKLQPLSSNEVLYTFYNGMTVGDGMNSSTFLGASAGSGAFGAAFSAFVGKNSGLTAASASYSAFLGFQAGEGATEASESVFLGYQAGLDTVNAAGSTFIGYKAGVGAGNSAYSNLIGYQAGTNNIGPNNIVIGTNVSLPVGRRDSINLGGVIFATGSYFNTTNPAYTGSAAGAKVGILVVNPTLATLEIGGNVYAQSFTGSFSGSITAAISSSYALSASYALNATTAIEAPFYVLTSSFDAFSGSVSTRVSNLESTSSTLTSASASFAAASGSTSTRLTDLESFSSSLDATFATDAQLNAATASLSASLAIPIASLESTASSLTSASASFSTRTTALEATASTLTSFSASYVVASGSVSTRLTDLETTSSAVSGAFATTSASLSSRVTVIETTYATTGSNTFTGTETISGSLNVTQQSNLAFLTASGLIYPTTDGTVEQFLSTDGAGTLSFANVRTLYQNIRNRESVSIAKGAPLFVSGSTGDNADVFLADASNPARMPATLIAGDTTLAPNATGRGIILGHIEGVDTTGYPAGTLVYVGAGGGWTSTAPTGSAQVQPLGVVTRTGTNGMGIVLTVPPNSLPNIQSGYTWVGDVNGVPQAVSTSSLFVTSGSYAISASFANTAGTAISAPYYVLTASYNNDSSSLSTRTTNLENTASVLTSASASFASQLNTISGVSGSYATTGSNTFVGAQYISNTSNAISFTSTASLYTDGGFRVSKDSYFSGSVSVAGDFTVFGTASVNFVTSSTLVGLEFINLNTDLPALRYAGINVGDSGSAAGISSSFWYDSENNDWIFVHSHEGSEQTSSIAIFGPIAYNNVGNEVGIAGNYLTKGQLVDGSDHDHHITSSQIYDDGTTVAIAGNLQVTGSLYANSTTTVPFNVGLTSTYYGAVASSTAGTNNVFTLDTGSYTAAKFIYTVAKGTSARMGEVLAVWNGGNSEFTDVATQDINSTTDVTVSVSIVASQLKLNFETTSTGWAIKSQGTLI